MGGKGSAPPPPDYVGAAQLQGQLSKEALNMQNYANRPVQNTPWSTVSWGTQNIRDPSTGQDVTQWTQNTTLAPALQEALDDQINMQRERTGLATDFMGRVGQEYGTPFDWNTLPQKAQLTGASQLTAEMPDYTPGLRTGINFDTNYRDRVANEMMTRMQPVHERQLNQLETQLANQGFNVGSEGYKRALDELQQRQSSERFNALGAAGQEASRLFGMEQAQAQFGNQAVGQASALDMARMNALNDAAARQQALNTQYAGFQNALRQQAIAEQMQRRGMSLNEMNALLTGQQVQMPTMPSFTAAGRAETPNILGATQSGYDAQLGAYNAEQAGANNFMGGLFSLGGAALSNPFIFSDVRLKSNIERVATHPIGIGVYDFDMFGTRQRGVIAQEVQQVRPDLVRAHPSGYLQVNYGGL